MIVLRALVLLMTSQVLLAQEPVLSPDAPPDRPVSGTEQTKAKIEEAIQPYIDQAKATYPAARERFVAGLPEGHSFFVTTRIRDRSGTFEQVFIAVRAIEDGRVVGRIWSQIQLVRGFKFGDRYSLPESEIVDWLITRPDGSEEGNFVGKFLDTYGGT